MMKKYLILMSLGVLVVGIYFGVIPSLMPLIHACEVSQDPDPLPIGHSQVEITITGAVKPGDTTPHEVRVQCYMAVKDHVTNIVPDKDTGTIKGIFPNQTLLGRCWPAAGSYNVVVEKSGSVVCSGTYAVAETFQCTLSIPETPKAGHEFIIEGKNVPSTAYFLQIYHPSHDPKDYPVTVKLDGTIRVRVGPFDYKKGYTAKLFDSGGQELCSIPFDVYSPTGEPPIGVAVDPCWDPVKKEVNKYCASDKCLGPLTNPKKDYSLHNPRKYEHERNWTALGCIPNDPAEFVAWILARAVGIGGGIAFLLMLWGGFQVITSAGDPQKLNDGKDILVSAAAGLLFIIFSLFLLRIVGVDILGLPGFNP